MTWEKKIEGFDSFSKFCLWKPFSYVRTNFVSELILSDINLY